YSADMNGAIIHHEKAHIQKNHSSDMILSDFFTCLFWFNPFSWLLRREIQSVHEYQADEEVLKNGIDAKQYQLLLIRKSVGEYKFALANNFRQRDLHKRITMMIKTKTNNKMKWAYTSAFPVLILAVVALSVPKLNAQVIRENSNEPFIVVGYGSMDSLVIDVDQLRKTETGAKADTLIKVEKIGETQIEIRGEAENQPIYILDGKKITNNEFKEISVDDIYSISVLKNESATAMYGNEGKNGVIIITTKNNPDKSVEQLNQSIEKILNKPLYIVDGEKMPKDFDVNSINPDDIESVNVLKGESAVETYGDEGKNGVILINLKTK
ncbi:MAG: TonB-dependent receptor plug domain-containing protein, partial [Fermentimonas sp.]|nr:TonB-dependent receptor plug domain-containing protein [Fermentimonas sp.]